MYYVYILPINFQYLKTAFANKYIVFITLA